MYKHITQIYILKTHQLTILSDPVYVQTYEQQISFFHHMPSCSITLSVSLLHCFHPETYFVLHLETLKVH